MFVDEAVIEIEAGHGGKGSSSFRREKYVPKGGPDGGDGGDGGSVYVVVKDNLHGLANVKAKRHFKAENGEPGHGKKQHGKNGQDIVIEVPPGTIIVDQSTGDELVDLKDQPDRFKIAKGGKGGLGNVHFASSTNRAPREFTPGTKGEQKKLYLVVKHLADIGLIGLPNAGKSTLLTTLTASRSEIGNYPFTTLEPHLGVMDYEGRKMTIADIPGLIKGASLGKGLGHKFLKHVQRVGLLVHLVSVEDQDPEQNYREIRQELIDFDPNLAQVTELVVISKIDLVDSEQLHKLRSQLRDLGIGSIVEISAKDQLGIGQLKEAINSLTESL
ncbi:GTPase ObgE [Candidatus Berkelbacteria bacterium]|nr:GTPase ObgE [Candidatus Berkelbacteria bacterium]